MKTLMAEDTNITRRNKARDITPLTALRREAQKRAAVNVLTGRDEIWTMSIRQISDLFHTKYGEGRKKNLEAGWVS